MKIKNYQKGEMELGMMFLFLIVAVFIIWVLTGGSKENESADKPYIRPFTDETAPLEVYGPNKN